MREYLANVSIVKKKGHIAKECARKINSNVRWGTVKGLSTKQETIRVTR